MIRREHRQITGPQPRQKRPHPRIEPFQLPRIARNIAAVPEIRIELHEVRKGQRPFLRLCPQPIQMIEKGSIILALVQVGDPPMTEDIPDLADGMRHPPRPLHPIQQRRRRRRNREIPPVPGPMKIARPPHERPRNRPPHLHGMQTRR